jgi:predicted PurR-regulated permease PerM
VTLSVLCGVCLWAGYLALGINYPILLALAGALGRLIPWLGPALVVSLPAIAGSVFGIWGSLAAVTSTFLTLNLLERTLGTWFFPRQRTSSLLLMSIMIALADSRGFLGVVLAAVLAVAIQILVNNLLPVYAMDNGGQALTTRDLQEKMESVQQMIATLDGPEATETANLASRLIHLIEKASGLISV